jgi:hypothetical protein
MTQPSQRNRPATIRDAVAGEVARQLPASGEPPAWWTPQTREEISRYVSDPAFREALPPARRQLVAGRREAAIARGLIKVDDFVPGNAA